ncbi:MAG: hypothetical protein IH602_18160 [Bryobacteraceae bacterium]|nr:hypothetical protein [Bryobacteraceae bacterium]
MAHTHQDSALSRDSYILKPELWQRVRNTLAFAALVGWIALGAGFALNRDQFHFSYLVAFAFCISITLGALFYVQVQHLTGSAWSVTVRRLMETLMRTIPAGLILFIPIAFGIHTVYEWSHASAASDPILQQKAAFLNSTGFIVRGFIVLALWSIWAVRLYSLSRKQDASGSLEFTRSSEKWSAPGVLILFLSASLASFDWIMSLDPHWWSTMFGVYFLAGGAVAFMAVLIAVCLGLRSAGYLSDAINEEHYHDLGKWLFALTVFWAYVTFSQYMLIWYGNLPEEGIWYHRRMVGSWSGFMPLMIIGHFIIPFVTLMPRSSKRNLKMLGFFSGWMLVMHYLDLYWQVMPVLHKTGVAFHWIDLAALVALVSTFGLVFWSGLRERPLVPVGDPRLEQCLGFHNA